MILFIALPESESKTDTGTTTVPLQVLPRRCPICGNRTIVGHGLRRKQAHDSQRTSIRIRRGRCPPCRKTFTILPVWSPPYCHYSIDCRRQAWDEICANIDIRWEQAAPHCKDPTRLPDAGTLRQWASARLVSLWCGARVCMDGIVSWKFFQAPTILAWDSAAASRILLLKANSP